MKKLYVWYSPATDVTGNVLKDKLEAEGGTAQPPNNTYDTVLCWGAKTSKPTTIAAAKVFNRPDNIRINRNKLEALNTMLAKKCAVAPFSTEYKDLVKKNDDWPVIARTKFHQGGSGFWLCLTQNQVAQAVKEGAQYFQKFIDIEDEYRLHVVGDEVIYAVKKVPRENHKEAFNAHWGDHVKNFAKKQGQNLDEATLQLVLDRMARKMAGNVDMVTRSNTRGWKFSKINKPPEALVTEAVKAVKALGLDFGAVDCCVDVSGKPWIIECNSGPGLDGSTLDTWITALKKLTAPVVKKVAPKEPAPPKAAAVKKAAAKVGVKAAGTSLERKIKLQAKMELMNSMLEAAGEDETKIAAVEGLWSNMSK